MGKVQGLISTHPISQSKHSADTKSQICIHKTKIHYPSSIVSKHSHRKYEQNQFMKCLLPISTESFSSSQVLSKQFKDKTHKTIILPYILLQSNDNNNDDDDDDDDNDDDDDDNNNNNNNTLIV
jgi:hypothetical protein